MSLSHYITVSRPYISGIFALVSMFVIKQNIYAGIAGLALSGVIYWIRRPSSKNL